jgi:poly(A) polymerase
VSQSEETVLLPLDHPILSRIGRVADGEGIEAFVVGGYVRDHFLGKRVEDLDVVVLGDGIAFARSVARELGGETVVAFERFGTAMVPHEGGKLEFVGARTEVYDPESRDPLVRKGTLQDDLLRRDFTINAMAASLNRGTFGLLHDPLGGRRDLETGILRTPLDPRRTFEDDPLRIMRAVRFAAQLSFRLAPEALEAIRVMAGRLSIVSQERITEEFFKLLAAPKPSIGIRLMFDSGVLQEVFPEVAQMAGVDQRRDHHHKDVFLHTCTVLDNISQTTGDVWLRFAALMHDIAKPRTKSYRDGAGWTFHGHEEIGARMMKKIFRMWRSSSGFTSGRWSSLMRS